MRLVFKIPFTTPKLVCEGQLVLKSARKILRYKRDILPPATVAKLQMRIDALQAALPRKGSKTDLAAIAAARKALETDFGKVPGAISTPLQENTEVLVVAIILALGLRAHVIQPFKIPTGSMQPTLNGIIAHNSAGAQPPLPVKLFQLLWLGRSYYDLTARQDEMVTGLDEKNKFLFFTSTTIETTSGSYTLPAPRDVVLRQMGITPGKTYRKGDHIARGYVETGDQVFVDKISYHFIPPRRGEVFVFKTNAIAGIRVEQGMGAQHYIKRLAGLPGDEIRIEPPVLYLNGKPAEDWRFRRVIASKNGYRGYSNGGYDQNNIFRPSAYMPNGTAIIRLPPHGYYALGDNSYHSYDSRGWGPVPERNLVGRGFFVWWPFNSHWGVIDGRRPPDL